MGTGFWAGLTFLGLIGGLIFLFLLEKDILRLPNPKIAGFAGYVAFQFLSFFSLFFAVFSTSFGGFPTTILYLSLILFLAHPALIIGLFSFFKERKYIQNYYCNFTLSYFLTSLIIGAVFFTVIGIGGLATGRFGSMGITSSVI